MRPRPTAPENIPTSRRNSSLVGCSPVIASGANTGIATIPVGLGVSSRARSTSAVQRRSSARIAGAPTASPTSEAVTVPPSGEIASMSSGSTMELAPNGPHGSSAAGLRPVKPIAPRRTGPAPRAASAGRSTRASRSSARHAASAARKRSGPSASTAHARPIPTSAVPSDGRCQSAASRSASTAAA